MKRVSDWKEENLRQLASRLILVADEVALRGEESARFVYVIGKGRSAEISWDENGKLWVEFWDRLDDDAEPTSEATFDDINQAETEILKHLL